MKPEQLARKIEIEIANRADGETLFDVLLRELKLSGLGAAVSAPQPRCPKCGHTVLCFEHFRMEEGGPWTTQIVCEKQFSGGCGYTAEILRGCELKNSGIPQFFAAAPAQERWYTKEELHDALIARNYEPKIADELAGWIADQLELAYKKGKERSQEQPVENSPRKGKP